jgi:hypothetical protein
MSEKIRESVTFALLIMIRSSRKQSIGPSSGKKSNKETAVLIQYYIDIIRDAETFHTIKDPQLIARSLRLD